jgi:hypothetical protein
VLFIAIQTRNSAVLYESEFFLLFGAAGLTQRCYGQSRKFAR